MSATGPPGADSTAACACSIMRVTVSESNAGWFSSGHAISMPCAASVRANQRALVDAGDEPAAMTPGEVATFLREERQRWEKVIRTAGITAQ